MTGVEAARSREGWLRGGRRLAGAYVRRRQFAGRPLSSRLVWCHLASPPLSRLLPPAPSLSLPPSITTASPAQAMDHPDQSDASGSASQCACLPPCLQPPARSDCPPAFNFSSPTMQNQIHELAKTLPPPRKQNTACDACRSVSVSTSVCRRPDLPSQSPEGQVQSASRPRQGPS